MKQRQRIVMDGLKTVPSEELHSFIRTFRIHYSKKKPKGATTAVTIPRQISRSLGLVNGDKLLVAIKKASPEEEKEFVLK